MTSPLAGPSSSPSSSSASSSFQRRATSSSLPRSNRSTRLWLAATALLALLLVNSSTVWALPSISDDGRDDSRYISKRNDAIDDPFGPLPNAVDFYNPNERGGSLLTIIPRLDVGEPINAIISGRSSRSVLNPVGFLLWATSVRYGVSCLGSSDIGTIQSADLGDGNGPRTQGSDGGVNGVLRYNYGSPYFGTCRETFEGGSHMRWFPQNGSEANSQAIFLAVSTELSLAENHMIDIDGYNVGRNELVGNATNPEGTSWEGNYYNTTVVWIPAGVLLNATTEGVNHPSVALPGEPSQDGRIAVLTVTQLAGSTSQENLSNGAEGVRLPGLHGLLALFLLGCLLMVSY